MIEQFLVVYLVMDIEPVPQVTTDDDTSEAKILDFPDGIKVHTA